MNEYYLKFADDKGSLTLIKLGDDYTKVKPRDKLVEVIDFYLVRNKHMVDAELLTITDRSSVSDVIEERVKVLKDKNDELAQLKKLVSKYPLTARKFVKEEEEF